MFLHVYKYDEQASYRGAFLSTEHMSVNSRAFGLAAKSSAFIEIFLRGGESVDEIKLTYSKATVRTSERLLTFEASGLSWKELRF